jgi:hypothetical protein
MLRDEQIVRVERGGLMDQTFPLYFGLRTEGALFVPETLSFSKMDEASDYVKPIARLTETECQVLMDSLWSVGIRPTEGAGSAGAMAAVRYHLEDMRKLVFS